MKFILAEKKEMTQKFMPDGTVIPVTRVLAGPCVVTQVKKIQPDGYNAIQVAFGTRKKISKPLKGHLKDLGNFRYVKEFVVKPEQVETLKVGDKIINKVFTVGDIVKVTGTSKGLGFQGVVKRHGFHGSPATHGHKDQLRMPGSIGAGGNQRVFKGVRMAGHMGDEKVTVTNLEIIEVNPDTNEIFIKGGIPGHRCALVLISGAGDIIIEKEEVKIAEPEVAEVKEEVSETPVEKVEEKIEKEEENKEEAK